MTDIYTCWAACIYASWNYLTYFLDRIWLGFFQAMVILYMESYSFLPLVILLGDLRPIFFCFFIEPRVVYPTCSVQMPCIFAYRRLRNEYNFSVSILYQNVKTYESISNQILSFNIPIPVGTADLSQLQSNW